MEVLSTKLVLHEVENEYIQNNCTPNVIKGEDFVPNTTLASYGMFAQDIDASDLVVSLQDIDNNDNYGYFFFDIQTAKEGNKAYIINKVVFDERLNEKTLGIFIQNLLYGMVDKNLRQDRIIAHCNYQFSCHTFMDTYMHVANDIIKSFKRNRDGHYGDHDYMELLRKIGEKFTE